MDDVTIAIYYIFILSLLLILVVYFQGVQTDVNSFNSAITSLINVGTGRNQQGQFANYPGTNK